MPVYRIYETVTGTPKESTTQLNTDLFFALKYKNKAYCVYYCIIGKNVHPLKCHEGRGVGNFCTSILSLKWELRGVRWSTSRSSHFTTAKHMVRIVQESGRAPWPVWTGAEKSPPPGPTGVRIPICPACIEWLYRVR